MDVRVTTDRLALLFMGLLIAVTLAAAPEASASDAPTPVTAAATAPATVPTAVSPEVQQNGPSTSFLPVAVAVVLWRLLDR